MNPRISIGSYAIVQLLILVFCLWLVHRSGFLSAWPAVKRTLFTIITILYIAFSILPVAGTLCKNGPVKFACQGAGDIWLGFLLYFEGILVVGALLALIVCGVGRLSGHSWKFCSCMQPVLILSVCAGAVLLVYGMLHAQNTVVTEFDVTIDKPAGDLKEMKLVLLGDLHLSVNSNLKMIRNMVDEVNKQEADAVVIAGDIFTSSYEALKDPDQYAAVLSQIKSRYGTYAVYGNHDVEENLFGGFPITPISEAFRSDNMEQFFRDCNFHVLYDETAELAGGAVLLTGRVDGEKAGDGTAQRKSPADLLAGVDTQTPVIILQHEPVEFAALKENGADAALCGHTHAGQVFPGNLIVPFFNENAYGYKNVGGLETVVTSGIGYYGPPMRVGTNSEIAIIHIHF